MDPKLKDLAGRVIKSTGRGTGRGALGVLNWTTKNIIVKIIAPAAVAAAIVLSMIWGGAYYWHVLRPEWNKTVVTKLTPVEIEKASLDCDMRMGWEDGQTDLERLFAAIAGYNLSKEINTGMCDVMRKFMTLRAPGNPVKVTYRPVDEADTFKGWSQAQLAQISQLEADFKKYLQNPQEMQAKYSWLSCVTRYKRTTYKPWLPWPDKKLNETMRLVYTSPSGAEYFCSR